MQSSYLFMTCMPRHDNLIVRNNHLKMDGMGKITPNQRMKMRIACVYECDNGMA